MVRGKDRDAVAELAEDRHQEVFSTCVWNHGEILL
jgi:hypothetical protein